MQIVNVQQGTDTWHALRAKHFTASEAPVMMAASSKMRRDELLSMKATGTEREVSDWVQTHLFDKGHEYEAATRAIVENMIDDELFPATAISDDGRLLASFDGITMTEDTLFEHKMWNASLAEHVRNHDLPPEYYWQLEQQLLVSGASRAIFVVSDGTEENFAWMEYKPVEGRASALIAGWDQFESDLKNYSAPVINELPTGKTIMRLPALLVEIEGTVKQSNLAVYEGQALAFIRSINTNLTTDQEFADAEETVKFCEKAEKELDLIKQQALSQTEQIDRLFRTIDTLREEMRGKRLELTRLVKSRKDEIRADIITKARNSLAAHIDELNATLSVVRLPTIPVDFVSAIKGKKTLTSLHSAANDELARAKIEANQLAAQYQQNLKLFDTVPPEYKNLFADLNQIIGNDWEHLQLLIEQRIGNQKKIDESRLAAQAQQAIAPATTQQPTSLQPQAAATHPEQLVEATPVTATAPQPDLSWLLELLLVDLASAEIKLTKPTARKLLDAVANNLVRPLTLRH
ncbi:YqaJ viral recombinase family protein [Dickeya zeae]|uniref:YqaJ viral recombinase family protein n=1 Tax=Dickeya zeae TaxID=204042 RepID=UPI001CFB1F49|nr:YqaJ viral recombinase family protein [Dickeya zeae]UCZ75365.1 YqaJ viral recombinase family protein [Dickeya zeae]